MLTRPDHTIWRREHARLYERKRLEVVAAVSSSGQAAIKRLLIDGKLVHQEPPY